MLISLTVETILSSVLNLVTAQKKNLSVVEAPTYKRRSRRFCKCLPAHRTRFVQIVTDDIVLQVLVNSSSGKNSSSNNTSVTSKVTSPAAQISKYLVSMVTSPAAQISILSPWLLV